MNVAYVTVPAGVFPGETISIQLPDGRMLSTEVPYGMTAGSTFGVQYSPDPYQSREQRFAPAPTAPSPAAPSPVAPPGQKLLLIQVPWGTPPGATVNIEVPDEPWRTISAQVPPNVTEFHVAYTPESYPEVHAEPVEELWQQQYVNDSKLAQHCQPNRSVATPGQKLLLIQVPRGTPPGSTVAIEVPDEPWWTITAQVPPNVTEFQVAYTPESPHYYANPGMPSTHAAVVVSENREQAPPMMMMQEQVVSSQNQQQEQVVTQNRQREQVVTQMQQGGDATLQEVLRLQQELKALKEEQLEQARKEKRQKYTKAAVQVGVFALRAAMGV